VKAEADGYFWQRKVGRGRRNVIEPGASRLASATLAAPGENERMKDEIREAGAPILQLRR
jgi:hypothetical protein